MDPYTIRLNPTSRDRLLRMAVAEAGQLGVPGMAAVIDTIFNRASHPYFQQHAGGGTVDQIMTADGQFEPWSRYDRDWENFPVTDELMAQAGQALDAVIAGNADLPFEGSLFFQNRSVTGERGTDFHNADAYLGDIGTSPVSHSHYGALPGMSPLPGYRVVTEDGGMTGTVTMGPVPGQPMQAALPSSGLLAPQAGPGGLLGSDDDRFPLYGLLGFASGLLEAGAPSVGVPRSPGAMGLRGAMQGMQMDAAQGDREMQRRLMEAQIADLGRADPTSDIQNYLFALQNGFDGTFAEFQQASRGPLVTVQTPSVPPGYYATGVDELGQATSMAPTPGGPVERELRAAEEQAAARAEAEQQTAEDIVFFADRALGTMDNANVPVTGRIAQGLAFFGDETVNSFFGDVDSIRANLTFEKLQEIRENSPTGGAVGNASDADLRLLADTAGSLDIRQSREQLRENIVRIRDLYAHFLQNGMDDTAREMVRQLTEEGAAASTSVSQDQQPATAASPASPVQAGAVPPAPVEPMTVPQAQALTTQDVRTMSAPQLQAILSNPEIRDAVSDAVFDAIELRMIVLREASR